MTATANQVTITKSWVYMISASLEFANWWSTSPTRRIVAIKKNTTTINENEIYATNAEWAFPAVVTIENLVAWDIITVRARQLSTVSLNVYSSTGTFLHVASL